MVCRGLRNRTPSPVPFTSMNSTGRAPGVRVVLSSKLGSFRNLLCPFLLRSLLEPHARASAILVDELDQTALDSCAGLSIELGSFCKSRSTFMALSGPFCASS
jgi:hypothetical protein